MFVQNHYHKMELHYLSVAHSDGYKQRAGINQHVMCNLVTALFRDSTKPIFSLRLPFVTTANTLTHFLTEQICNFTTSHSSATAFHFLCKCLCWIWRWIYFSIRLLGTVKSTTLYKADTESYLIRELWHYNLYQSNTKEKVIFYAWSLVNIEQMNSLKL